MIGEKNHGIDCEWVSILASSQTGSEQFARRLITKEGRTSVGDEREEERAARDMGTPVVGHFGIILKKWGPHSGREIVSNVRRCPRPVCGPFVRRAEVRRKAV